jgi:hypothetical protein
MRVLATAAAALFALTTLAPPAHASVTPMYRYEIINRAISWLTANNGTRVPYDSSATWGEYRQDCSGYVSMAAKLDKPGPITQQLATSDYSSPIRMGELKRGDIVVDAVGDRAQDRHVVIFDRWVDTTQRAYYAYEQRGDYGTDHRTRGYGLEPYSEYKARRLNNVIDR